MMNININYRKIAGLIFVIAMATVVILLLTSCGDTEKKDGNAVFMSLTRTLTTLDPSLAADSASRSLVGAFYDTPLQYKYQKSSYALECAMLDVMPQQSDDGLTWTLTLKDGLLFQNGKPFENMPESARLITSRDLAFSILRLADTRIKSPGFSLVRGKIKGLDEFRKHTAKSAINDFSPYDLPCEGLETPDDKTLIIRLESADPRFSYALALTYFSVVSRHAIEYFSGDISRNPSGSGPFMLDSIDGDHALIMKRNPDFRDEFYNGEKLPVADTVTCYFIKQPFSAWLMFLQGNVDYCSLDGDNFEAVVGDNNTIPDALAQRGIKLVSAPQLETNYIGFSFADPILGGNPDLRRAISLVFDRKARVIHSGGKLVEAYSPVPPGVPGYLENEKGPFGEVNIGLAKEYLKKAGYENGVDPATGNALVLKFDQAGSGTFHRQTAELMARDLKKIGIELEASFNTRARFLEKLAKGDVQMFRLSWEGDYPDAENFLQLFHSKNAGGSNRVAYKNSEYDAMFEKIISMPDSEERTELYKKMSRFILNECPWISESYTSAFILTHSWLKNYIAHDFAFNRWKYLSAPDTERKSIRKNFTPLDMSALRHNN